jgi:hypothetical protein
VNDAARPGGRGPPRDDTAVDGPSGHRTATPPPTHNTAATTTAAQLRPRIAGQRIAAAAANPVNRPGP